MSTMLLHDFAYVPIPAARVCEHILANDGAWLAPLASAAAGEGEALRLRIGPLEALPMLGKSVTVRVGQSISRSDVTVVPLTWQATSAPGLFPVLSADLEIASLGAHMTQLTLHGRYDPPLGAVGRRMDRLLMHRIAEATVRGFLSRLADGLAGLEHADVGLAAR
jgi:hypothetical protein